jgi:hypothetical protein
MIITPVMISIDRCQSNEPAARLEQKEGMSLPIDMVLCLASRH